MERRRWPIAAVGELARRLREAEAMLTWTM